MPAITYADFSGGLDRRLPINVQDANRLWTLKNAYITSGKRIKKRPGLKLVSAGLAGSVGLESLNGGIVVFVQTGSSFTAPAGVGLLALSTYSPGGASTSLVDVLSSRMFQGFPYIVAVHNTAIARPPAPPGFASIGGTIVSDVVRHHYIDGTLPTLVSDVNCSHGASAVVAAEHVFTTGGEVVRYSAAGNARDWTTADDAGFLPVALRHDQRSVCTAVGNFRNDLAVFFAEGAQLWNVEVDPSANEFLQLLAGVGTDEPHSMDAFYQDLAFLSPYGIRSIAVQQSVERIDENDVGVPIDSLVVPSIDAHAGGARIMGAWLQQLGQYWVMFDAGGFTRVYAYSFSRSSKLACWSVYDFPVLLTGIATSGGKVYARTASSLYELSETQYTDAGTTIDVDVQMAYQDAKLPGVEKQFYGADYVFTGTAQVSYLYDPRDQTKETNAYPVTGDSRSTTLVPVEVTAAAIAPRFRHAADEAFGLDMATLYYHPLSAQAS
jgi:hypothetical protein